MAQVNIEYKLKNIVDNGGGYNESAIPLVGLVPLSRNTIVTNKKFSPRNNYAFSKIPIVSFTKTKNPERYSYTQTKTTDANGYCTSISFTIHYLAPLQQEFTNDIITISGEAVADYTVSTSNIYDYNFSAETIPSLGAIRHFNIYGDPNATCTIDFRTSPLISPGYYGVSIIDGPKTIVIPQNGLHKEVVTIPPTSILTNYELSLTETVSGSFQNISSNTKRKYAQYPIQHTRLTLSDSALGTTLPSTTQLNFYNDYNDNNNNYEFFSFQVYKNSFNFALKPTTFDASLFTTTSGVGATYTTHTIEPTSVEFFDLNVEIDNDGVTNGDDTRAYAVISGRMKILSGYDAGGRTDIALNVNDILKSA